MLMGHLDRRAESDDAMKPRCSGFYLQKASDIRILVARDLIVNPRRPSVRRPVFLAMLAYFVPTFILGYVWHLALFADYYHTLGIYRSDVIVPFGFMSMLLQGAIFAGVYPRVIDEPWAYSGGLRFAAGAAMLSWTFTTLAVAAKHPMTSVSGFVGIETAFTLAQFALVGLLFPLSARLAGQARPEAVYDAAPIGPF